MNITEFDIRLIKLCDLDIELWSELYLSSVSYSPFYHPLYIKNLKEYSREEKEIKVALGYFKEQLVFATLMHIIVNKVGIKSLSFYAFRGSDHVMPLTRELRFINLFFNQIYKVGRSDLFYSKAVNASLKDVLQKQNFNFKWSKFRACPFISLPRSEEEFLSGFKSKVRYNLRREWRIAGEQGIDFFTSEGKDYTNDFLFEELVRLHALRFKSQNKMSKFLEEAPQRFHKNLVNQKEADEIVRFYYAKKDSEIVAIIYGFEINDAFLFFMQGFDIALSDMSLGKLVVLYAIKSSIKKGLKKFDFLRGNEAYKRFWTKEVTNDLIMELPLSRKGRWFKKALELYKRT